MWNLDAILNSKISLAEKNGIRVDYKAACPANLTVSDIDLCALIGNLIDNAVEACEGLADPYIRLLYWCAENQLYISVTNATKDTVRKLDSEVYHHEARKSRAWAETDQSCCGKVRRDISTGRTSPAFS